MNEHSQFRHLQHMFHAYQWKYLFKNYLVIFVTLIKNTPTDAATYKYDPDSKNQNIRLNCEMRLVKVELSHLQYVIGHGCELIDQLWHPNNELSVNYRLLFFLQLVRHQLVYLNWFGFGLHKT